MIMAKDFQTKRVRGSAIYYEDGSYTFTPYEENPQENTPWSLLADCPEGKVQMSKNVIKLEIRVKPEDLSSVLAKMNKASGYLLGKLLTSSVSQKYEKLRKRGKA